MKEEFYLDNAATTCVAEEVIQSVFETMENEWYNPSSLYTPAQQTKAVVEKARKTIADYINCKPSEIIFTSGACEANSLAICGWRKKNSGYIITSNIEHKSIVSIPNIDYTIHVDEKGFFNFEELDTLINDVTEFRKDFLSQFSSDIGIDYNFTFILSTQAANSEIGTIQDIKRIADIVHKYNGIFHCDATQLFPYQRIDVKKFGIDMLSMSGQKINTPKGIGFLYVKEGIELEPLIYGSQENGLRAGTENVPYIAGLAKAIELLDQKIRPIEKPHIQYVRDYMEGKMLHSIGDCIINGSKNYRLPNNINISFKGIESESLLLMLNQHNIYVSAGSACNSGDSSPSYVLQAIKVPEDYIRGTIRITLPDDFTFDEADYVVGVIKDCVERLRKFGEK